MAESVGLLWTSPAAESALIAQTFKATRGEAISATFARQDSSSRVITGAVITVRFATSQSVRTSLKVTATVAGTSFTAALTATDSASLVARRWFFQAFDETENELLSWGWMTLLDNTDLLDSGGIPVIIGTGGGDAFQSQTLDQFANVTQAAGKTFAITDNAVLSGTNTGDQTNISGNAATVSVIDAGADTTCWFLLANQQTGNQSPATNPNATFNAATGAVALGGNLTVGTSGAPRTLQLDDTLFLKFAGNNRGFFGNSGAWETNADANLAIAAYTTTLKLYANSTTAGIVLSSTGAALTGVPTAPTAAPGTNTTQIATTAFVIANTGVPTAITVANEATDATCFLGFFTAATGDLSPKTNANLTLNSSTGVPTFGAGVIAQKAGGTASYLTASLIAADGTTPTKGVRVWYDAVNDVGQIQAVDSGVAFKNLVLQGAGGGLGVGIGCVPVWSASLEIASGSGAGRFRFSESSGIVQFGAVTNTVSGFVPLAIAGSTLALQTGGADAVAVDANRAVTLTPASSAIGQRIKLAATPSAHALDIDSSGGSGGNLAYISQTGGGLFAGGLLIGSATPSFGDTFAQINRSSSEATYPLTNPATQGLAGASLLLENTNDGNNTHVCVSLCPVSNSWAALLVGRKTAGSSTALDFYTSNAASLVYAGTITADGLWGIGTGTATVGAQLDVTQAASASGTPTAFKVTSAAHTNLTTGTECIGVNFNMSASKQFAAGAKTTQREVVFQAPTYTATSSTTTTTAATIAITGAPIDGANHTTTNPLAFWVQAGATRLDGAVSLGVAGALTIASDTVTVTKAFHVIDTEAAAATDNLATINGGKEGMLLVIRAANNARDVVVKDGTGNIQCAGDMTLDNVQDTITLIYDGTNWIELCRSNNSA